MASTPPAYWYRSGWQVFLLTPVAWLFRLLTFLRRTAYRLGLLKTHHLPVPVIVVGNIAVGGSGKTPVVMWLVEVLRQAGWHPGVISRGYGGTVQAVAEVDLSADDPCSQFGDEPVLMAQRLGCPVFVGKNRPEAGKSMLVGHFQCDLLISDDGLQHYALGRTIELVVVDEKVLGNRALLPAGPLRESVTRLKQADFCLLHGEVSRRLQAELPLRRSFPMTLKGEDVWRLGAEDEHRPIDSWHGQTVHGVAGIGRPQRFFATLRQHGLHVIEHPFPDHHQFCPQDLQFGDDLPVLMTEKDAVKCRDFALPNGWVLPVTAEIPGELAALLLEKLNGWKTARSTGVSGV